MRTKTWHPCWVRPTGKVLCSLRPFSFTKHQRWEFSEAGGGCREEHRQSISRIVEA